MPSPLAARIVAAFQGLNASRPDSVEALLPLYAQDVEFRDPIQYIRGLGAFMSMNKRLLGRTRELTFEVKTAVGEGDTIFLAWSMRAVPKLGPKIGVDGTTHLVTRNDRVVMHRDYWDLGELMTSPVPRAHAVLQFFLKPLGMTFSSAPPHEREPMSKDEEWSVLPHGPIEKLSENLWRVEGELPQFSMKRVMTVARRSDGDLVIHSAIALEDDSMAAIEAFGRPAFLLIPHVRHRLDAAKFKRRYPAIRVLATKGARAKAEEVVHVEGTYEDFPPDGDVSLRMLRGVKDAEGAMLVRSDDGMTVVLNEVVFDVGERPSLLGRMVMRAAGVGPGPRVTPFVKLELVRDKKALRADLCQLAETPDLTRLIVSHERMSSGASARAVLRKAAGYL